MKRRLITSADKTFNSSIEYDEKSQRWRAEKNYTETEYFLSEDQAQQWIQERAGAKNEPVSVSEPVSGTPLTPKKPGGNILPPPPKPTLEKKTSIDLPVGHPNPKVSLPIANNKHRLIKAHN